MHAPSILPHPLTTSYLLRCYYLPDPCSIYTQDFGVAGPTGPKTEPCSCGAEAGVVEKEAPLTEGYIRSQRKKVLLSAVSVTTENKSEDARKSLANSLNRVMGLRSE